METGTTQPRGTGRRGHSADGTAAAAVLVVGLLLLGAAAAEAQTVPRGGPGRAAREGRAGHRRGLVRPQIPHHGARREAGPPFDGEPTLLDPPRSGVAALAGAATTPRRVHGLFENSGPGLDIRSQIVHSSKTCRPPNEGRRDRSRAGPRRPTGGGARSNR